LSWGASYDAVSIEKKSDGNKIGDSHGKEAVPWGHTPNVSKTNEKQEGGAIDGKIKAVVNIKIGEVEGVHDCTLRKEYENTRKSV